MSSLKCVNVTVHGKVQGVWYRASTKKKAEELGVFGFVVNEDDGSVYAEIEGPEEKVNEMIKWCGEGPEFAHVSNLEISPQEQKGFTSFEIYPHNFRA